MKKKQNNNNRYVLNQSPLYKLRSRKKLASILRTQLNELEKLAKQDDNYRIFNIHKDKGKPREINEPKPQLRRIQHRLFSLLRRISVPDYLHSGSKGKSYISNAEAHVGHTALIKLDITKFFPSTKYWHTVDFFKNTMKCSPDVAGLLTNLLTCNGHIPTGSSISQFIGWYL